MIVDPLIGSVIINSFIECNGSTDVQQYLQLTDKITFNDFVLNMMVEHVSESIFCKIICDYSPKQKFKHQNIKTQNIKLIFYNHLLGLSQQNILNILSKGTYNDIPGLTASIDIPQNKLLEFSKSYGMIYTRDNPILKNHNIWLISIPCSQKIANMIPEIIEQGIHIGLETLSLREFVDYSKVYGFLGVEYV